MLGRIILVLSTLMLVLPWLAPCHAAGTDGSAASWPVPADPHTRFTAPRPPTAQCLQRGQELIDTLRKEMAKYRDIKAAEAAGYGGYYTDLNMPMYHFASKWRAFKELMRFDPAQPTALLYKKTNGEYELIGVMYYAPGRYSEDSLDQRVPLCLARWHRQVNVCLPPGGTEAGKDPRFDADGTIATEADCSKAGGKWNPEIHGWMVEVYPFENDPRKIWGYRPD
ncbi:MAG: hypothetical protein ACLQU2_04985 [Candidatus Binataceae bacterium]